MRTREEIHAQILTEIAASPLAAKLTSTSGTAIWRLWVYIQSFIIYVHERIVLANASNSRSYTARWLRDQALNYIDGCALVWSDGRFEYDTASLTEEEIAERRIVTHCAVEKAGKGKGRVKIATTEDGLTVPISAPEFNRFKSVMTQIAPVGTKLDFVNNIADDLKITLKVWVDELVIDLVTGALLNVEEEVYPVKEAARAYLNELEFNGAFVKTYFVDKIQTAEGVKIPKIMLAQSKYAAHPWTDFDEYVTANSGHFKLADDNFIIIYESINNEGFGLQNDISIIP